MFRKLDETKGPKSIGKTYDGVNVLKPKTKSKNFTPTEVRKSIKKAKTNKETMSETVRNIIDAAMENNAIEVQTAIHTAIGEKIQDALEAKRVVVAQNLVGIGESLAEAEDRKQKRWKNQIHKAMNKDNKSNPDRKPYKHVKSQTDKQKTREINKDD